MEPPRMFRPLPIAMALSGCVAPAAPDGAGLPLAYTYEDSGPAEPSLTPAEAADALQVGLVSARSYSADVVFVALEEMMVWADGACPVVDTAEDGTTLWDEECTTAAGARFVGFVSGFQDPSGTGSRSLFGEATVTAPDGPQLVLAGGASAVISPDGAQRTSSVEGVFRYDGPAAVGTWLQDGVDLALTVAAEDGADGTVETVGFDGSVGVELGAVSGLDFVGLTTSRAAGYPCPEEPSGRVGLRDGAGVWMEVVFDVAGSADEGWSVPDGACDGCGALVYGGETVGAVCVDLAPVFEGGAR